MRRIIGSVSLHDASNRASWFLVLLACLFIFAGSLWLGFGQGDSTPNFKEEDKRGVKAESDK